MKSFLAILIASLLVGCASVKPGNDPVVVNAERVTSISFSAVDGFLRVEHANHAWFAASAPDVTRAANELRQNAPRAFRSARAVTRAYKANRTPTNKATLDTALDVVQQFALEATRWFDEATRRAQP